MAFRPGTRRRSRNHRFEIHLGRELLAALDFLEQRGHLDGTKAVGHRVVQLGEEGTAITFQPVDHHEEPQRPGAVEGILVEPGGEIVELAFGSGAGRAMWRMW